MKLFSLIVLTFFGQMLIAQTFTEVTPTIPFDGVSVSSIAFSDVDGDGDQDLLITGANNSGNAISNLHINDGVGNFTLKTGTTIESVYSSSIAFADIDGDNDQDLLITGVNNSFTRIAKLYTNDGTGNFTEVMNTSFPGVSNGSIAFADVDGDNDQDVLITGVDNAVNSIAKLYMNDGTGSFTLKAGTPFEVVWSNSIAFADVDGDGDQDVLITGRNNSFTETTKMYINGGTGNYTFAGSVLFDGVSNGSVAFSDIDGDNDQDVLITGYSNASASLTALYTNDGAGVFTKVASTSLEDVSGSSIAFADVNGDNNQDVLITGGNNTGDYVTKLYTNGGTGNFTEVTSLPFENVLLGSVALADVNGDGSQDVFITGENSVGFRISKLYTNDMVSSIGHVVEELPFDFTLYPNPAEVDNIQVSYSSEANGSLAVKVFDLTGRLVKQQENRLEVGEQTFSIDIASLAKGAYFIELNDGKRKGTRRLMVL